MEHAHFSSINVKNTIYPIIFEDLYCEHCNQLWSSCYDDYAGMQDIDFIICTCGEQVCQVGELKQN